MRFSPVTKPIPLKAVAIDALDCQQLGDASRISTTPSRLPCPRISLNSSSNSKHRNGDRPLYGQRENGQRAMRRRGLDQEGEDWTKSKKSGRTVGQMRSGGRLVKIARIESGVRQKTFGSCDLIMEGETGAAKCLTPSALAPPGAGLFLVRRGGLGN